MGEKLINLKQMRDALVKAETQIAFVAGAAAEAVEEVASSVATVDQIKEALREVIREGSPSGPPDPVEVYQNTRPADWLPMPEPADNEMYLLFHIPDGVSSLLAFTVTCTGNYTVETGTVSNGTFVPSSSTDAASGSKYEAELFAKDYGNLTSDGMKQVMIKVSGMDIKTWIPSKHSKKTSPADFACWDIMEIKCRLPKATAVKVGDLTVNLALQKLRYYTQYGPNNITNMLRMFAGCNSLISIPQLDTANVWNMSYMFRGCCSLTAIPQLDTSNVANMNRMFQSCYSLTTIPQLDTANVTDMGYMFSSCCSLTAIPQLDTSNVTDMGSMFSGCYSLTTIPQLDTSNVTDMGYMFQSCYSLTTIPQLDTAKVTRAGGMFANCTALSKVTLIPTVTSWAGYEISLSNCSLGHAALVDFFNSLPSITVSKTITLTGNPGVPELTEDEKAIATGKNWTLTL